MFCSTGDWRLSAEQEPKCVDDRLSSHLVPLARSSLSVTTGETGARELDSSHGANTNTHRLMSPSTPGNR